MCGYIDITGNGRGDPHITTLDGKEYTFNGHGEYVLVKSGSLNIQARTQPAQNTNGSRVQATVFTALAIRELNMSTFHIGLSNDGAGKMAACIHGDTFTSHSDILHLSISLFGKSS